MNRRSKIELKGPSGATAQGPSTRQLRVAEEIRRILADLFARTEFRDPDLMDARVTVTEVRVAPDFRYATAFVSRLGRSDIDALMPALKRIAPFMRTALSKVLKLRTVPEITFLPDTSLDHAMELEQIFRSPEVSRDLGKAETSED